MRNSLLRKFTTKRALTFQNINQNLIKSKYEVRGGVVIRAEELRKQMEKGEKFPFDKLVQLNIGNPQSLGQLPITFPREVLGHLFCNVSSDAYGRDVVNRVNTYKKELRDVGEYTHFKGMSMIRENVARFITNRDEGGECNKEDVFLSNGASGGIKVVLQTLLENPKDTIMTPIPQYPLYSACIQLLGCTLAGYYLDEANAWSVDVKSLQQLYRGHYDSGHALKALVIINPGNPTGNILSEENLKEIIKFAYEHKLVILADEVYQNNIYSETKKFISTKKVLNKMPHPYNQTILFSFNSTSKGFYGECGLRGGYTEMTNAPEVMRQNIFKLLELGTCPNIVGQVSMDLLINPPNEQTCSHDTVRKYQEEVNQTLHELKVKAMLMYKKLNTVKNMKCNEIEGAMYAFPSMVFPEEFIQEAKQENMEPDYYYALKLLENTGLMTVPGSGFKQKEGTYHIRLTNLICPKEEMIKMLNKIEKFNEEFFQRYY